MSNHFTRSRRAISNPKICNKPPKITPPSPTPIQWPPPYIDVELACTSSQPPYNANFRLTTKDNGPRYMYTGGIPAENAEARINLDNSQSPPKLQFSSATHGAYPIYYASAGPTVAVERTGFALKNTQWQSKYPYDATIAVTAKYP